MCGIAGGFNLTSNLNFELVLDSLRHRGPDKQQYIKHNRCVLAHTRLSILDQSSSGSQPFHFQHLICVFNGEIYNYQEIRQELRTIGYLFESTSDTEVLVKAFHCWKLQAVHKFIGMFAFAIYDKEEEELFLFRDRVGVKPLYYSYTSKGEFYFGSEMKTFYNFPVSKTIKKSSLAEYFRFGYNSQNTIFNEIEKVPPGHYLHVKRGGIEVKQYWDIHDQVEKNSEVKTEGQWLDELEETMISAFKYRMRSDVPVGVFLSGGIDSSLVASILQKHYGTIRTFTMGFDVNSFSEATYAKKVASFLKTEHTEQILSIDNSRETLLRFYDIYDEPFADSSGVPTSLISSMARDKGVKVVLSADGGDELFGGYTHYLNHARFFRNFEKIPSFMRNRFAECLPFFFPDRIKKRLYRANLEHKLYAFEELLRTQSFKEFYEVMVANQTKNEISNLIPGYAGEEFQKQFNTNLEPVEEMMLWDFLHYLPNDLLVKVDRATMFHSIEGRDPFLDHRLVSIAHSMPMDLKVRNRKGKYALRKILSRYLPEEYFERPKMGFSIPLFAWFEKDFDSLFDKYLSEEMVTSVGILNYAEVQHELKKYKYNKQRGHQHNIEKMWRLLSFMMWWEKWGKNA